MLHLPIKHEPRESDQRPPLRAMPNFVGDDVAQRQLAEELQQALEEPQGALRILGALHVNARRLIFRSTTHEGAAATAVLSFARKVF